MSEELQPGDLNLNEREVHALRVWQGSEQPPLSPGTNAQLFALFLNGKSTEEIRRMNPQFTLGQIVHARVKGEWDRRLDEHLSDLLDKARERVQQVQLEQVDFLGDMLTAANLKFGDAVRRYIQTRNDKDLAGFGIQGLRDYKSVIEMWLKLTGQENGRTVKGEVVVTHRADDQPQRASVIDAPQAEKILGRLAGRKD